MPNLTTADGPAGLRIQPEVGICITAWLCATLLAATWDLEILSHVAILEQSCRALRESQFVL